jgi:hypothetical protein
MRIRQTGKWLVSDWFYRLAAGNKQPGGAACVVPDDNVI